jgi:hypothetical protein
LVLLACRRGGEKKKKKLGRDEAEEPVVWGRRCKWVCSRSKLTLVVKKVEGELKQAHTRADRRMIDPECGGRKKSEDEDEEGRKRVERAGWENKYL